MTKKTAKRAIKTPIITVVPQPGATLPYSELSGFSNVPKAVTFAVSADCFALAVDPVAIECKKNDSQSYFLSEEKDNNAKCYYTFFVLSSNRVL